MGHVCERSFQHKQLSRLQPKKVEQEMYEFKSKDMTDLKLYDLLKEASLTTKTNEAKKFSKFSTIKEDTKQEDFQSVSPILKIKEYKKSHVETPVIENACNLLIKTDLDINDYKIENVTLKVEKNLYDECFKQEHKLIVQPKDMGNLIVDNLDHIPEPLIKKSCKSVVHLQNLKDIEKDDTPINNLDWLSDLVINKFKEDIFTPKEAVIKVETHDYDDDDKEMHEMALRNWNIKNEELDIKEELTEISSSIIPDCVGQDSHSKCEIYPQETHDQFAYHTPLNNNSWKKLLHNDTNDIKKLKCDQCSYKTIFESRLNEHLLRHRNPDDSEMFKCNKCNFQDIRKQVLKRHLFRHHNSEGIQTFQCSQCSYKAIERSHLKNHFRRHRRPEEVNIFKCNKCTVQTIHERSLKRHQLLHNNPKEVQEFTCHKCDFKTIHKRSLKRHQLLMHNNPEEVQLFTCSKCYFQTIHKKSLKRHLLRHDN